MGVNNETEVSSYEYLEGLSSDRVMNLNFQPTPILPSLRPESISLRGIRPFGTVKVPQLLLSPLQRSILSKLCWQKCYCLW
jgi:hypothetical protein